MSVVRGMRGVGGVCEMCMCLARGGVGGEWMRRWVWALPILWEQGRCWTCLCFGCRGEGGEWVVGLDQGLEVRGGVMSV